MSRAFRRAAATLLVTTAATLAGAAPSHAYSLPRRAFEDPARSEPARSFLVSFLLELLDFAGGAMDPNGKH